jgi:hypothetical protein
MVSIICWKCKRSVEPLERREKDKKHRKTWLITYCPFERCNANLDIQDAPAIRLWNGREFFNPDDPDAT